MSYYDILLAKQLSGGGGDITVESLSVTANGTYRAPSGKAYSPVSVNVPSSASGSTNISSNGTYDIAQYASAVVAVPNSYSASDEGKVVSSGALVAQTSETYTANGTYDTTLKNSVTVNVSGGGGGGITADEIALRTISGVVSGNADSIVSYAFTNCTGITGASFPSCTVVNASAFAGCASLVSASFPACTSVYASAFAQCFKLKEVNLPSCTSIGTSAFAQCSAVSTVSIPNCKLISSYAFFRCESLASIELPKLQSILTGTFQYCTNLSEVIAPSCKTIQGSTFYRCFHLTSLNLTGVSSVPTLVQSNAFTSTPIGGYTTSTGGVYGSVFVPASLYNSFVTASEWSTISARIVSVP